MWVSSRARVTHLLDIYCPSQPALHIGWDKARVAFGEITGDGEGGSIHASTEQNSNGKNTRDSHRQQQEDHAIQATGIPPALPNIRDIL